MIGDDFWCRHLVAMRGALDRMEGVARARLRMATRGIVIEAMVLIVLKIAGRKFELAQC